LKGAGGGGAGGAGGGGTGWVGATGATVCGLRRFRFFFFFLQLRRRRLRRRASTAYGEFGSDERRACRRLRRTLQRFFLRRLRLREIWATEICARRRRRRPASVRLRFWTDVSAGYRVEP
jgi:hypothetical protein